MNVLKNKVGAWAVSIIESTLFGFVSRAKANMLEFLEDLPEKSTSYFYKLCLLLVVVIIGGVGTVLFISCLFVILVQYFGPEVNKVLLTGQILAFLGLFFMVSSALLIVMIGKSIKSATDKSTRKLARKLTK